MKLDTVQFLLEQHTSEHFPFLDAVHSRFRTTFYQVHRHPIYELLNIRKRICCIEQYSNHLSQALGRLLMLESAEDIVRFERFMEPFSKLLQVCVYLFAYTCVCK